MRGFLTTLAVMLAAGGGFGLTYLTAEGTSSAQYEIAGLSTEDAGRAMRLMRRMPGLHEASLHQQSGKVPPKPGGEEQPSTQYTGDDSCRWANDGECDDPGIGTGACTQGTDYSDCWRIATGVEDDSCQWANDGECDEPRLGTGACTQATDRTDCGEVASLRFRNDSCETAFNGICDEPGTGSGTCAERTDRADCVGRDRPMRINDHFFGHDDRVFMNTSELPWVAVGTLVDENGGSCTASLIADDILITAAHCIEYESGLDATGTFTTGFDRAGGPVTAEVIDFFVSPERQNERGTSEEPSNTDWALLRIDQPLGQTVGHMGVLGLTTTRGENGAVGTHMMQAGYSWDTGSHLSGNLDCELIRVEDANKMAHNCDTTQGDSGSPFIVEENGEYFVVGVDSTYRIEPNVPAENIATRADGWLPYLEDFMNGTIGNGGVRPQAPASGKVPGKG